MNLRKSWFLWLAALLFVGLCVPSCGGGGGGGDDDDTDDDADDDAEDNTPPDFDGAQGAETIDYHTIRVWWDAATDDHTDADQIIYSIYAVETGEDFDFSSAAQASTISRTEASLKLLKPATDYKFVVRATDLAGNQEDNENEVSAATDELPSIDCGGIGGDAAVDTLYVKVVDQNCNAIEGALVWTNDGDSSANTNATGEAELELTKNGTTVNVSAAMDGYISMTFFEVPLDSSDHVAFRLEPYPPTDADLFLSCGTMDPATTGDIPQANDILENLTVAGFVVESLTKEQLLEFDLNSLLGPNIPFSIPGIGEIELPSNIWIPPVEFAGITLSIDPFFVPLKGSLDDPHTIFAYVGAAFLTDILENIGDEIDISAIIALVSPQKMGVMRQQMFEEGDPENPSATFEVPLDYPLVDLSGGPTDDPEKIIYPLEGSVYGLPTNFANPGVINLLGGDLGDDGLIGISIGGGEYPTLAGITATGALDNMEFLAISIAAVADRDSPYLDAFSGVIAVPDFGGGDSGTVTFEEFLNFTLANANFAARTYSWEDTENSGTAPELAVLNWMDADRQLVWKGFYPNPYGSRVSVTVPALPTKAKVTDMHTNIDRFQVLLAQHVWFDYADFPIDLFLDLVTKVSGKETGT